MDQDAFWSEIKEMNAYRDCNDSTESPSAPSPTELTIFSEDDLSFESVTTLPTPLKHPRYSSDDTVDSDQYIPARSKKPATATAVGDKFVAANDVPKRGTKNFRFNKIRPTVKQEEEEGDIELAAWLGTPPILLEADAIVERRTSPKISKMYRQSVGEVSDDESTDLQNLAKEALSTAKNSKVKPACDECRKRKRGCNHNNKNTTVLQPKSGNLRKPKAEINEPSKKPRIKTEPAENRVKKDGTPYLKVPHDRSKGPSMTPSAVDFRERKDIQQQYQDRLAQLLDDDIVKQVEAEGGITPLGRLFKASVRMLERVQVERRGYVETMTEPMASIEAGEPMDLQEEQEKGGRSVSPLDIFKAKLQALIDEPE